MVIVKYSDSGRYVNYVGKHFGGPSSIGEMVGLAKKITHAKKSQELMPLDKKEKETLGMMREAFGQLDRGDSQKGFSMINSERSNVIALLKSENGSARAFAEKMTQYTKMRFQNTLPELKFVLKLLQQAGRRDLIISIRKSPHENIAKIAERY